MPADTKLMDLMGNMFKKYNLDYWRTMNCPVGLSVELFSINYLQNYIKKSIILMKLNILDGL